MCDEVIGLWLEKLAEDCGVENVDGLSESDLRRAIMEEEDNLENERIWNVDNNVAVHEEYLSFLRKLLDERIRGI